MLSTSRNSPTDITTMNFGFLNNLPKIEFLSDLNLRHAPNPIAAITESSKQLFSCDVKLLGWSLLSFVPFVVNVKDRARSPVSASKRELQEQPQSITNTSVTRFRPYVSKVPWHGGARAFLSQLFPRYGHYCGPNWSSGKDGGSLLWDQRPIDWLDFCCYCHDIGYDTDDQAQLLKADLAFLECLERPRMETKTKGDTHVAHLYKTMCITGLRNILIPYRSNLVRLQQGKSPFEWAGGLSRRGVMPFEWLGSLGRRHVEWLGSFNNRTTVRCKEAS